MALPALVSRDNPGDFGPYSLVEQLGQGGMAIVYRAAQRGAGGFQRDVVLKAMLPNLVKSAPLVEMFEAEARLTAQLRHPNIVQVEDYGVASGIPYLIMEFLDGRNLSQLRNTLNKAHRKMPIGSAVAIARDLCLALGYAHHFVTADGARMQVIHRDISPSNVMVLRDGTVRLLDFGVAKMSSAAGQAVTTSLKGKFAYMAPEQVNQEPIDRRCDVFAAGIVLHELLTGRRLFGTKSELETLRRVSLAEASPPSLLNADVPPELDALVMKALSRLPGDRFDSGVEMAAALDGLRLACSRRELTTLINEVFPAAAARAHDATDRVEVDGDTEVSGDNAMDGITAPERAISVPHLVVLPGDDAIVSDLPDAGARTDEIEIEAEPSAARLAPARPEGGAREFEDEATAKNGAQKARAESSPMPLGVRPLAKARSTPAQKSTAARGMALARSVLPSTQAATPKVTSPPAAETMADEGRAFPGAETMAAPIDEIRPTRIYDPSTPAIAKVRGESDFEHRPTKVYDAVAPSSADVATNDAARAPAASSSVGSELAGEVEVSSEFTSKRPPRDESRAVIVEHRSPSHPALAPAPAPVASVVALGPPDAGVPTAFHGFEPVAPPTTASPARPRRGSLFLVGGLIGAMVVAASVVGIRYGVRARARIVPTATSLAPSAAPPAAAPAPVATKAAPSPAPVAAAAAAKTTPPAVTPGTSAELAAPSTPEPRLPSALPQPLSAETGTSLVGLDRGATTKPRAAATPAATPAPARQAAGAEPVETRPAKRVSERAAGRDAATAAKKGKRSVKEGRIVDPFADGE